MATLQGGGRAEKKKKRQHASFHTQCIVLTRRSFVNMRRDVGYYWLRLVIYIALAVALATVFYDLGMSERSIQVSNNTFGSLELLCVSSTLYL